MSEDLDRIIDELCWRRTLIVILFIASVALVVIQLPYLIVTEPGSSLFVISTMNLAGFSVFAIVSGFLLRYCDKR